MTLIQVSNTETRPDGSPKPFGRVEVGIVPTGFPGSGTTITDVSHDLADVNGLVTFQLQPSPTGTWYVWNHSDKITQTTFQVPASGGPYTLDALRTTPAPAADPATTQAAIQAFVSATVVSQVDAEVATQLAGYIPTTQKGAASGVASLDGSTKIPIAQIPTGTSSSTVAAGNDSRITGAAQKASNLSDIANAATARGNLDAAQSSRSGTRAVGQGELVINVADYATVQAAFDAAPAGTRMFFPQSMSPIAVPSGGFITKSNNLTFEAMGVEFQVSDWGTPVFRCLRTNNGADGHTFRIGKASYIGTRGNHTGATLYGSSPYCSGCVVWTNGDRNYVEYARSIDLPTPIFFSSYDGTSAFDRTGTGNRIGYLEASGYDFALLYVSQVGFDWGNAYCHDDHDDSGGVNPTHAIYCSAVSTLRSSIGFIGRWQTVNHFGGAAYILKYQDFLTGQALVARSSAGTLTVLDCDDLTLGDVVGTDQRLTGNQGAVSMGFTTGTPQRTSINRIIVRRSSWSAWVASTAVALGAIRTNGSNAYTVTTAGTTAGSGGPTGTGTGITDGTAVWSYLALAQLDERSVALWSDDGYFGVVDIISNRATQNGSTAELFVRGARNLVSRLRTRAIGQTALSALLGNSNTSGDGAPDSVIAEVLPINSSNQQAPVTIFTTSSPGARYSVKTLDAHLGAAPTDGGFYSRGQQVRHNGPSAAGSPGWVCTTNGYAGAAWAISTAYTVGKYVTNGGNTYVCTVAGTSAGSGGPTGTGTGITDGTVTWNYVGAAAVFKTMAVVSA